MNLLGWVLRHLRQHRLKVGLSSVSVVVGMCLVSVVMVLRNSVLTAVAAPSQSYSLVVGAPGSTLELVLGVVLQARPVRGTVSDATVRALQEHPSVERAVPIAMGDSFRGSAVIATTSEYFRAVGKGSDRPRLRAGRLFDESLAGSPREAVVGAGLAQAQDIRVGDFLELAHGQDESSPVHAEHPSWLVVGILESLPGKLDRSIWIDLQGFWDLPEHAAARATEPRVSAVLVYPKRGVHKAVLLGELSRRADVAVSDVASEVLSLIRGVGDLGRILFGLTALILAGAILSVGSAVYTSVALRRRELAILRLLGATRGQLLRVLVLEVALVTGAAGLLGMLLGHGALAVAASKIREVWMLDLRVGGSAAEFYAWLAVVVVACGVGLLPGLSSYYQDVEEQLRPDV